MLIPLVIAIVLVLSGAGYFFITQNQLQENDVTTTETEDIQSIDIVHEDDLLIDEDISEEEIELKTAETTSTPTVLNSTASYLTPRRTEHTVQVSLTLVNDMVIDAIVQFDNLPEGEFSNSNQERFHDVFTSEVIGKSIDDISLSRAGGASLTSNAFNEAVQTIRNEVS